jgi:hypothetical protein
MLREVVGVVAETEAAEETEAVLVEEERVERVDSRVQTSTAEEVVEAEAKDPW